MYETSAEPLALWTPPWPRRSQRRFASPTATRTEPRRAPRSRSTFAAASTDRLTAMFQKGNRDFRPVSAQQRSESGILSNALRSLRSGFLASNPSNKSAVVDADDVVFIPNADKAAKPPDPSANCHDYHSIVRELNDIADKRKISLRRKTATSPNAENSRPLRTLEDIRQLYKSVPNFEAFEEEERNLERSRAISGSVSESPFFQKPSRPSTATAMAKSASPQRSVCSATSPPPPPLSSSAASTSSSTQDSGYRTRQRNEHHRPKIIHQTIVQVGSMESPNTQQTLSDIHSQSPAASTAAFTFSLRDIRILFENNFPQQISKPFCELILERFRRALEEFGDELKRCVGPFGKCSIRDVNLALMSLLNEREAFVCIDYATHVISGYSTAPTLNASIEERSSLRLNVGKMFRWIRLGSVGGIVFDVCSVYLSAVFEKLLFLFLQNVEKFRESKSLIEAIRSNRSLFDGFRRLNESKGLCVDSVKSLERILTESGTEEWRKRWLEAQRKGLRMDADAKSALFEFLKCPKGECRCVERRPNLSHWISTLLNLIEHRNSVLVNIFDVLESARILRVADGIPQRPAADFVDSVECLEWRLLDIPQFWEFPKSETMKKVLSLCDFTKTNAHSLSALSRCILLGQKEAVSAILRGHPSADSPIVLSNLGGLQRNCKMFDEFLGWSAVHWAVAVGDAELAVKLAGRSPASATTAKRRDSPLQISAAVGNPQILRLLLKSYGTDLFATGVDYDSTDASSYGTLSALGLAAAAGNADAFGVLLEECYSVGRSSQLPASIADLLRNETKSKGERVDECTQTATYSMLPKSAQLCLREALYFAVHCGHLDLAFELTVFGVRWNVPMWSRCLQWAMERKSPKALRLFIDSFQFAQLVDCSITVIDELCLTLFEVISVQMAEKFLEEPLFGDLLGTIAEIYIRFSVDEGNPTAGSAQPQQSVRPNGVLIDPKFCDNEKYSDIRFLVGEESIFAHRIALVNASPYFEALLQNNVDSIRIRDVDYPIFKALIEYIYGKESEALERIGAQSVPNQMSAINAADKFGLPNFSQRIEKQLTERIDTSSCALLIQHAYRESRDELLAALRPFVLRNLENLFAETEWRKAVSALDSSHSILRDLGHRLSRHVRDVHDRVSSSTSAIQKF